MNRTLWYVSGAATQWEHVNGQIIGKTVSLPTFVLDGDLQGIMSADHAVRIGKEVVNAFGAKYVDIHLAAAPVVLADPVLA